MQRTADVQGMDRWFSIHLKYFQVNKYYIFFLNGVFETPWKQNLWISFKPKKSAICLLGRF
jgi:hypothetical protein